MHPFQPKPTFYEKSKKIISKYCNFLLLQLNVVKGLTPLLETSWWTSVSRVPDTDFSQSVPLLHTHASFSLAEAYPMYSTDGTAAVLQNKLRLVESFQVLGRYSGCQKGTLWTWHQNKCMSVSKMMHNSHKGPLCNLQTHLCRLI